jgi:hypothetical protein
MLNGLHFLSLMSRADLLDDGRPAPGDTKKGVIRLLMRAATELSWPKFPRETDDLFSLHLRALLMISRLGEPEAAIEILSRHLEDIERSVVAPDLVATYCIYRLEWLLSAAIKFYEDDGKRCAYVAEAKGLMERATLSLRGLPPQDWDETVSDFSAIQLRLVACTWLT